MNKKVEYVGAAINIPFVLSGIQEFVEGYIGSVVHSLIRTKGIIRPQTKYLTGTPPCRVSQSGGKIQVAAGQIFFNTYPYPVFSIDVTEISTPTVATILGDARYDGSYVYAVWSKADAGIYKRRAQGFVYNPLTDGPTAYWDESIDTVTLSISYTVPSEPYVRLARLFTNTGFLVIDQTTGADFAESNLPGNLADRSLNLNSVLADLTNEKAGFYIPLGNGDETAEFLIAPSYSGSNNTHWITNYPIAAPDPVADNDVITKSWFLEYVSRYMDDTQPILNFKLIDIETVGIAGTEIFDPENNLVAPAGGYGGNGGGPINQTQLRVRFTWGYEGICGVGQNATNDFTLSGISFTDAALIGYHLWIPELSKDLKISSNVNNVLSLCEPDGSEYVFPRTVTITSNQDLTAWIHVNANKYELRFTPWSSAGYLDPGHASVVAVATSTNYGGPIGMTANVLLNTGTKYNVDIRALQGNGIGSWHSLSAGTYVHQFRRSQTSSGAINYYSPLLVYHTNIPYGSLDVTHTVENLINGYRITLHPNLWKDAEEFEIVYSLQDAYASFAYTNNHRVRTGSRSFTINPRFVGTWYFRIRPLCGGGQVCTNEEIETTADSIRIGFSYQDPIIDFGEKSFRLDTWEGYIIPSGNGSWYPAQWTTPWLPYILSPVSGVYQGQATYQHPYASFVFPPGMDGKYMYLPAKNLGYEPEITVVGNGSAIRLTNAQGIAYTLPANSEQVYFRVGTTEKSRFLTRYDFVKPVKIDRVKLRVKLNTLSFDPGLNWGVPVTIRLWANGNDVEFGSDYILISGTSAWQDIDRTIDMEIRGDEYSTSLYVYAWDPEFTYNWSSLVGTIQIWGREWSADPGVINTMLVNNRVFNTAN